jgi:hypothetical protein
MTHTKDEALKLALDALEKHGEAPKDWACKECVPFSDILKDGFQCKYHEAMTAIKKALATPLQELTLDSYDEHYNTTPPAQPAPDEEDIEYCNDYHCAGDCGKPHNQNEMQEFLRAQPAPDLQAELEATNRQVEILSDALAESRRELAALKAVQEPWGFHIQFNNGKDATFKGLDHLAECEAHLESGETITMLYTTPPAAQPAPIHQGYVPISNDLESVFIEGCGEIPLAWPPAAQPAPVPLTARELELIDGMIEVQLDHAKRCDSIANRTMAERQKGWDMERVALLQKLKEKNI